MEGIELIVVLLAALAIPILLFRAVGGPKASAHPHGAGAGVGRGAVERRQRLIVIHCVAGQPGPPYEVLGIDGESLGVYDTLVEAEQIASQAAAKAGASVVLSPLARGGM